MKRLIALAAATALLCACGGGAHGTLPSTSGPGTGPTSTQKGNVAFVIKIPPKPAGANANKRKSPAWISSSVQGVLITVTQSPVTAFSGSNWYVLGASEPYCSGVSGGLTCTLALQAPAGNDLFTVETFDTPNEAGWPISSGTVTANITAGAANSISVATGGIVNNLAANIDNGYPATGTATTIPVRAVAADGDGNIIVGPYDFPVTVQDSDTSGVTVPSVTSIPDSTALSKLTIAYNGKALATPATITVQGTSPNSVWWLQTATFPTATFAIAPGGAGPVLTPSVLYFASTTAAAQSFTASGGTAPYTAGTDTCYQGPFGPNQDCVGISGTSPTFAVSPSWGPFVDTFPVTDGASHSATEYVVVGPTPAPSATP